MFCRNCGAKPTDQDRFCSGCGTPAFAYTMPPTAPPLQAQKKSRGWIYAIAAIGVLLFMGMCGAILNQGTSTATKTSSSSVRPASVQPSSVRYKVGDNVFVGYWAYRCYGARWQRSIGSEYTRQYPDAQFLIVDLAIRNNDKTASVLAPLKLIDAEGREYEESSKGIFMDNSFGMLKSVNPGVSSRGYVVFDVPPGKYKLKVYGGYTSGGFEFIELP
jgi:hypothetical protein